MDTNKLKYHISIWQRFFPVFIIAQEKIYSAVNRQQLFSKLVKLSADNEEIQVINFVGKVSSFHRENSSYFPNLLKKGKTKKQIIEIYNSSRNAKETKMEYSLKSLSNKRKWEVFDDIYHLVKKTEKMI